MAKKIESLIKYEEKIKKLPIASIGPNSLNPRKRFVESEEDELIESIISKGVLNPIIVFKRKKDGKYTILDGERRCVTLLKRSRLRLLRLAGGGFILEIWKSL